MLFSVFSNENFVDMTLFQYGWEPCKPLQSYGPYIRNHYLFHYVISGKGILVAADHNGTDHTYHIHAGKGFLITPGQVTSYFADEQDPWEYAWLEFDGMKAREYLLNAGLDINSPVYTPKTTAASGMVKDEILYIAEHADASPLCLIGHLYLFLDALISTSVRQSSLPSGKMKDFYIKEAISYIEIHYQEQLSVEEMAESLGLNRSYFGKLFHHATGLSPQEFIIHFRMSKAAELLKTTSKTIGEIGMLVGYPNQLHFSRAFKNKYGISPKAFRTEKL